MADERMLYRARVHWMIFFRPAWPWILLFFFLIGYTHSKGYGTAFLAIFPIVGLYVEVMNLIYYITTDFVVTNKRLLAQSGAIRRAFVDIFLSKVESVRCNETILGRIFGYATVVVRGTGGTYNQFYFIAKPLELLKQVEMASSSS